MDKKYIPHELRIRHTRIFVNIQTSLICRYAGVSNLNSTLLKSSIRLILFPIRSTTIYHENETNFGSLGTPSAPILFFAKRCSVYTLLASSKVIPRVRIRRWTSRLPFISRPPRESPSITFEERSKSVDVKPDS